MTTTRMPEAPAPATRPMRELVPGAPSTPQVNLLPPEIRASRSLARVKQVLLLVFVLVVAGAAGGYYWAMTQVQSAQDELSAVEAETQRLLNAQKEYAEVPRVLGLLDRATRAREIGTQTEILWAPYLRALMATAPPGVAFENIQFTGSTPTAMLTPPTNPLFQGEYVGSLQWIGRSVGSVDAAAWIEALETVPGFTDAFVTSVEIGERDVNGQQVPFYQVNGEVLLTPDALARRFAPDADTEEVEG